MSTAKAFITRLRPDLDRFETVLLFVLILSHLALLVYAAQDREKMMNGDSALYEGLAISLLEGKYEYAPMGPNSDLIRPPGYPAFIAANYAVFGRHLVVPILWNLAALVALFFLMRRLLGRLGIRSAYLALVVLTLDLAWLLATKDLITEPIFTALLLVFLLAMLKGLDESGRRRVAILAGAGAVLALMTLFKPISLYLPVPIAMFLAIKKAWVPAAVFLAVFLVGIGPWIARNYQKYNSVSYTYVQNDNLLYGHAAFVYADLHGLTHVQAKDSLSAVLEARLQGAQDYNTVNAAKQRLAREVLAAHPLRYAKAIGRGVLVTLFDPGRLDFNRTFPTEDTRAIGLTNTLARDGLSGTLRYLLQREPRLVLAMVAYLALLVAVTGLAVFGIVPVFRSNPTAFWLLALVGGYLLILGGPHGYARFRLYVFPVVLVFAQFGWNAIRAALRPVTTGTHNLQAV